MLADASPTIIPGGLAGILFTAGMLVTAVTGLVSIILQGLAAARATRKAVADAATAEQAKRDALAAQAASSKAQAAAQNAQAAAQTVASVLVASNEETAGKLAGLAAVAESSHKLLNSAMAVQLQKTLVAEELSLRVLLRMVNMAIDPREKEDLAVEIDRTRRSVEQAKKMVDDHEARQVNADGGKP
jgi:hypothetical protein